MDSATPDTSVKLNTTVVKDKLSNGINYVKEMSEKIQGGHILLILLVITIFVYFIYSISYTHRTGLALDNLNKWAPELQINPRYIFDKNLTNKPLSKFKIASSYRPYVTNNQMMDYCSLETLQKTISYGARALYIDIFNSSLYENAEPVVSVGYEKGNWKLTLNTLHFDDVCNTISQTAFRSGYVDNYFDPLFLVLDLKCNNNFHTINKIQKSIVKYFKARLLPSQYSNANPNVNLGDVPIGELMNKVVIICSDGFQNTKLEELVNASWINDNTNIISFDSLGGNIGIENPETLLLDKEELKDYNDNYLTLVHPPNTSFFTYSYPSQRFFDAHCHFVFMNYTKVDLNSMETIKVFQNSSLMLQE